MEGEEKEQRTGEHGTPYMGVIFVMEQEVCDCGALLDYFGDCPACPDDLFWDEDENEWEWDEDDDYDDYEDENDNDDES